MSHELRELMMTRGIGYVHVAVTQRDPLGDLVWIVADHEELTWYRDGSLIDS